MKRDTQTQRDQGEDYFTIQEVARKLRVSPKKVRALIDQERLPAYDFGSPTRSIHRIPVGEFEEWEQSRRITAARRVKKEARQSA
jgi:excisionase family DNA binding protein